MNAFPAWTALGWTMLHLAWVGGLIGAVGLILKSVLRTSRPEIRYVVALMCLGILATAPFVLFFRVYEPSNALPTTVSKVAIATNPLRTSQPANLIINRLRGFAKTPSISSLEIPIASSKLEAIVIRLPWLWLAGSTITLGLLATGLAGVRRLRSTSQTLLDDAIVQRANKLAKSLGVARRFTIGVCDRLTSPVLLGILRPMILLPPSALSGWTADELEMALLHEISHLKRCDNLINFLQCLVESLLFFHPATWWLSSWVRLEREHCCDRLVVEKTGKSRAYAEMLASFVGVAARPALSAMAERSLISRIRKILNMEDQRMRLTFKERLGLIGAGVIAVVVTLGAQARPMSLQDKAKPSNDIKRAALKTITEKTMEMKLDANTVEDRADVLIGVAQEQFKIGDCDTAKATLRLAEQALIQARADAKTSIKFETVITNLNVAEISREFGDLVAARAALDRMTKSLEAPTDPKAKEALEKSAREAGAGEESGDVLAVMIAEAAYRIADERILLGDLEEARRLLVWSAEKSKTIKGEMKPFYDSVLGATLIRAGDPKNGRALLTQAVQGTATLPESSRGSTSHFIAGKLAESGDFDAAFAILEEQKPTSRELAAIRILDAFQEYDPEELSGWLDPAGIKILIGAQGTKPKNLPGLHEFAKRLRDFDDAKVKGRTLSAVATLLAKAGDFPAAIEAADAIPALKRKDFPGPSDGFYDSVKPATFAMVAARMAKKGDKTGSADLFDKSGALGRAIENSGEKLIAMIVLADSYAEAKDNLSAMAVISESIELAKAEPEPRRSRGLVMLVRAWMKTGDLAGAVKLVDSIREYPGAEKAQVLSGLAYSFEKKGDETNAKAMAKMALDCLQPMKPDGLKIGPLLNINAFGRDTYVDPDLEFGEARVKFDLRQIAEGARNIIGDMADAEKAARALPVVQQKGAMGGRAMALGMLAMNLVHKDKLDEALRIAGSIENLNDKLWTYKQMARAIREVK